MLAFSVLAGGAATAPKAASPTVEDLSSLSIEELSNVQVTSVFKRPEPLSKTPASVYVITREEIRRSGALTLPEALRLAPNLTVARLNGSQYAISARGFNAVQLSNKLLVLIDGRSIYTPLHAGVLWNEEQVMLENVERIEVISGPGGTIWGANAVNGVINVVTRDARDTPGGLVAANYGNVDARGAARYGGKLGNAGAWRTYVQGLNLGESDVSSDTGRNDGWQSRQAGMRADFGVGESNFTVEGTYFDNQFEGDSTVRGGNIFGRWHHTFDANESLSIESYYSKTDTVIEQAREALETFDIEAQHNVRFGERHNLVWGGGYRHYTELFDVDRSGTVSFFLDPIEDSVEIYNLFIQDSYALTSNLTATVGVKYEYNSYTEGTFLPSGRLAWEVAPDHMVWGAASRAVRTPSRIDRQFEGTFSGTTFFESAGERYGDETLTAYEIGYRGRPDNRSNLSITAYYHDYDDLRVIVTSPTSGLPTFGNGQDGYTMGVESWGDYQVMDDWRLMAGVNLMHKSLELAPDASTTALYQHQGNDPEYQLFLRSYYDLTDDIQLDVSVRKIARLPSPSIDGYVALDARIAWQATDAIEFSLTGTNLLDARHPESGQLNERGEIPRSVYVGVRWGF